MSVPAPKGREAGYRVRARCNLLRRERRRRSILAALLAVGFHAALVGMFRQREVWPDPVRPRAIGFAGPMRMVDLSPQEEILPEQQRLAQRRIREGALWTREVELDERPAASEATATTRPSPVEVPPAVPRPTPRPPEPEVIRFELQEDWRSAASSSPEARSEDLQTRRIVRPDYPSAAIWAGLEGLVRLEVRVSRTGRVLDIQVMESPDNGGILTEAAAEAMRLWEFEPYRDRGRTVPFTVVVPFRFRLID